MFLHHKKAEQNRTNFWFHNWFIRFSGAMKKIHGYFWALYFLASISGMSTALSLTFFDWAIEIAVAIAEKWIVNNGLCFCYLYNIETVYEINNIGGFIGFNFLLRVDVRLMASFSWLNFLLYSVIRYFLHLPLLIL